MNTYQINDMTKKEFYKSYWPTIQGKPISIYSGYQQPGSAYNAIITDIKDHGRDIYLIYKEGHHGGAATIRSIVTITIEKTEE